MPQSGNAVVRIIVQGGPDKNAQILMRRNFATVCSIESFGFHQNAQKLTGNAKNRQI